MAEKIYIRNASGELEPLTEKRFETEAMLEELVAQHPELLAGDQLRRDDPLRWILIKPQMPMEGWAVDLLLLDQDARPTLVEVKKGDNSDNRRKVVGQILDYAATAAAVWSGDSMRTAFEEDANRRGADPLDELSDLLQPGEGLGIEDVADGFWERAATNLDANRLRLLFVADEIPVELERVVKFLNEQTRDNLEVLAVEVKQYPGRFGNALVSRVIGEVDTHRQARSQNRRRSLSYDEFLDSFRDDVRQAIESLMESASRSTGDRRDTFPTRGASVSVRGRCALWPNPLYLGLLWLPNDSNGDGSFVFYADFWSGHDYPPAVRSILERWVAQFDNDTSGSRYQSGNHIGREFGADDFVAQVDVLSDRLCSVLTELSSL